jgi:hypothetical protein
MGLIRNFFIRRYEKAGYSTLFARRMFDLRYQDLFKNKNASLREKIWAQKRGFLSDKIKFYGLTDDNYKDYVSDFDYWRLHPINGIFSRWIDDKLTIKMILHPFDDYLPEYYYNIGFGEIFRLSDCPDGLGTTLEVVISLLKAKETLAAKTTWGSAGVGFYKLGYRLGQFLLDNQPVAEDEIIELITQWLKTPGLSYLLTEYFAPHPALSKIFSKTPNALRVAILREKQNPPQIFNIYIHIGTEQSGFVDNALAGGVFSRVDIDNGSFHQGKIVRNGMLVDCPEHPDTQQPISGVVPFWDLITKKVVEISKYLQPLRMMGFDIVITESGFKIIEINSHPSIEFIQFDLPAYKNPLCRRFYKSLTFGKQRQIEREKQKRFFNRLVCAFRKKAF